MPGRRKKAETELVLALACGATPEQAAQKAGVSVRTVYRRLTEAAFRAQVRDLRAGMLERTAAMLTAAGVVSVKTLTKLQESAVSESVRLGAARSTLQLGGKMRESVDFDERLTALEARSQGLVSKTTG
jgi:hypothetical protein